MAPEICFRSQCKTLKIHISFLSAASKYAWDCTAATVCIFFINHIHAGLFRRGQRGQLSGRSEPLQLKHQGFYSTKLSCHLAQKYFVKLSFFANCVILSGVANHLGQWNSGKVSWAPVGGGKWLLWGPGTSQNGCCGGVAYHKMAAIGACIMASW